MTRLEARAEFRRALKLADLNGSHKDVMRQLALTSLFYLLVYVLHRADADSDWVFDRCQEFQKDPEGHLDLWAREHYKSTILDAYLIQCILRDPEGTNVIFSFTRPAAKAFLRQIKGEFEGNILLKYLFDDVLWDDPRKKAPKWSEDDGIIVKRKGNPKESTLEAWGLTDGMPTGKHFKRGFYDDIVTRDGVQSTGGMAKTIECVRLSFNLLTTPGERHFAGTRYHYADTYHDLIDGAVVKLRMYTATKDGTETGEPVLWTREQLAQKIRDMGPYVSACQLFNNPKQDSLQGFKEEWLRYWPASRFTGLNIYILCDPANEKKKENDYTVFIVIGLGSDRNYYVLDIIRDRIDVVERANVLFTLHQQYRPRLVGYERYGMQADIRHYQDRMQRDNYRFGIKELGGPMPKNDRIRRLVPVFAEHRMYLPERCVHRQYDGADVDVVKAFIKEEYIPFPFPFHDDILDCLARIMDPDFGAVFPQGKEIDPLHLERPAEEEYDPLRYGLERR